VGVGVLWRPQARQWSFCLPAFVLPLRVILPLPQQRVQAMVSVIIPLVYSKQFAFNHYLRLNFNGDDA
jgi:hypothetical protein